MTDPADERRARALKANIGKQFAATPAPGKPDDPESWTAEGGTLDLIELARAIRRSDESAHLATYDTRTHMAVRWKPREQ